jgi:hypothetical protein
MMDGGWFAHGAGMAEKRKVSGSDVGVGAFLSTVVSTQGPRPFIVPDF